MDVHLVNASPICIRILLSIGLLPWRDAAAPVLRNTQTVTSGDDGPPGGLLLLYAELEVCSLSDYPLSVSRIGYSSWEGPPLHVSALSSLQTC